MYEYARIVDQRWVTTGGSPTDLDRYQYGYDQNSNRLWKKNTVGSGFDEFYTYDTLNRLTQMQRGTLTPGTPPYTGISGTPARELDYTLDPTGNWSAYLTKTSGATDLNQTRTANTANEITAIGGTPGWATPPAYDAAGNMTSMPQVNTPTSAYTAVYDAWNRMVSVSTGGGGGTTVAQYQYDGRGRRIVKLTYTGGTLTETRHFYWSNSWQDLEERVGTSTSADKQQVWGIRYVDELVCRDDATPERLYVTQDANFNVTALIDTSASVKQRFTYEPYGMSTVLNASWSLTTDAFAWNWRHQGLCQDVETSIIYNRMRYLHTGLGRFLSKDPAGYMDQINIYEYLRSNSLVYIDPSGLATGSTIALPPGALGAIAKILNDSSLDISGKISQLQNILSAIDVDPAIVNQMARALANSGTADPAKLPAIMDAIQKMVDNLKDAAQKAVDDATRLCKNCNPCDPPVGTIGYREDIVPPAGAAKPHYPHAGDHYHYYVMGQSPPSAGCVCFWIDTGLTSDPPPTPGAVPISTAGGGGPK